MPISKSYVRLFKRGVTFSTRSRKRLLVFLIVFAILSGMTIILVERWIEYDREELLEQRGVILRNTEFESVTATEGENLYDQIISLYRVESASIVKYFRFGENETGLRIFGLDIAKPWYFDEVNPSTIVTGSYLTSDTQALVSVGAQVRSVPTQLGDCFQIDIAPGNVLTFKNPLKAESQSYTIAGIFEEVSEIANDPDDREWLILSLTGYESLREYLDVPVSETYTYEITTISKGNPLFGEAYENTDALKDEIADLKNNIAYGSWNEPDWVGSGQKIPVRDRDLVTYILGIFGSLLVSTMYSYLVTRFKRRDTAILKALGYNANQVRMGLLAEILTVAGAGYLVAATALAFSLTILTNAVFIRGLSPLALAVGLGVVVLFTVPGMLLVSWKALTVRPIEVFRER